MKNSDFTINILTTDGSQYDYLIHTLENAFTVNIVIRELGKYQRKRLIFNKKYYRYICNRYQWFSREIRGYNKYRINYFKYEGILNSNIINVANINSDYVVKLLNQNPSHVYWDMLHFPPFFFCRLLRISQSIWLSFFLPIFVKNFIVTCNFLFSGKKTGAKICLISTPGFRNTHITTVALISNTIFQYYKEALLF